MKVDSARKERRQAICWLRREEREKVANAGKEKSKGRKKADELAAGPAAEKERVNSDEISGYPKKE